jgi:hypothetical protein
MAPAASDPAPAQGALTTLLGAWAENGAENAYKPDQLELPFGGEVQAKATSPGASGLSALQRISWARLLKRAMGYDVETCPRCGAVMRVEGMVTDPDEIALALDEYNDTEDDAARTAHTPRGPPAPLQLSFDFGPQTRKRPRAHQQRVN